MTTDAGFVLRILLVMPDRGSEQAIVELLRKAEDAHRFEVSIATPSMDVPDGRYVVLLGDEIPSEDAVRMTREIAAAGNSCLVIASRPIDATSARLLLAGASGFLYEADLGADSLISAVEAVARGSAALHSDAATALLGEWRRSRDQGTARPPDLSGRELDVLLMIARGSTTRQIARQLSVSEKTIEAHRTRLYAKLGAKNQAHAISLASAAGLLNETQ